MRGDMTTACRPTVSVIVPTYNRSAFVKDAVASVLAQEGVCPEIVVVDDGSSDGTDRALEAFRDRVRFLRRAHGGVSAARNSGIRIAAGEWLAFLDSDDLWLPSKLRRQLDFLTAHPEFLVCQTEEIWLRNGVRINPRKYHRKPRGHCFERLLDRCLVSPSAVMIHRDVFDSVGLFDENLPACEDYDLWLRIGCKYALGLIEEQLVVKRGGHPDQLSATVPALDRYRIRALANLLRSGRLDDSQADAAFRALKVKSRIFGEGCARRGKAEEAEKMLGLPETIAGELGLPIPPETGELPG